MWKSLFDYKKKWNRHERAGELRRYIDGEMPAAEQEAFRQQLEHSPQLQARLRQMQSVIASLKSQPAQIPPQRVWRAVSQKIRQSKPDRVCFPWLYAHPRYLQTARTLPVAVVVLLAAIFYWNASFQTPGYMVVPVKDLNGYADEIQAYVAHHDLSNEPIVTRESVIALYTYENEE